MAASAKIYAAIQALLSSALDLGNAEFKQNADLTPIDFTSGSGANQINKVWSDRRTLAASATENLDLAGVLADALGATITFTAIKAILIKAAAGNTNNVVVGGHATAAFIGPVVDATDKISVPPGGLVLLVNPSAAGWPVTATTADLLKIENSAAGTGVTYDVTLLGIG